MPLDLEQFRYVLSELLSREPQDRQIEILEDLRGEYPHSISLAVLESDVARPQGQTVNCYEWALGLSSCPAYWELLASDHPTRHRYATGKLIADLIPSLKHREERHEGGLVIYRTSTDYSHAGVVRGERVRSKWSDWGCVFDHPTQELLIGYGWLEGYFEMPPIDDVMEAYRKYREHPYLRRPLPEGVQ